MDESLFHDKFADRPHQDEFQTVANRALTAAVQTSRSDTPPETRSLEEDPLHSVDESCRLLGGISPYTLHSYFLKKKLARTKVGHRTMVRHSQLLALIHDGGKSPAPKRKAVPAQDAASTDLQETAELPETVKPAAVPQAPSRLYPRSQKSAL
jgi:hypothetical protein